MITELLSTQTGTKGPSWRIIAGMLLVGAVIILPLIGQTEAAKTIEGEQNQILEALEKILAGCAMLIVVADKIRAVWKTP